MTVVLQVGLAHHKTPGHFREGCIVKIILMTLSYLFIIPLFHCADVGTKVKTTVGKRVGTEAQVKGVHPTALTSTFTYACSRKRRQINFIPFQLPSACF